jgi:hypothetical protein
MKPKQIHKGHRYTSRIGRKLVVVGVDDIREVWDTVDHRKVILYDVTIIESGEHLTFRTHTKFRKAVGPPRFDFEKGKVIFPQKEIK